MKTKKNTPSFQLGILATPEQAKWLASITTRDCKRSATVRMGLDALRDAGWTPGVRVVVSRG